MKLEIKYNVGQSLWRCGIKNFDGADNIYLIKSKVTEIVVSFEKSGKYVSYIFDTMMEDESSFLSKKKIQWLQKDCYATQDEAYSVALIKKYDIEEEKLR